MVAKGTAEVRDISIWNVPTICYIEEGKITGQDNSTTGIIPMLSVEREGIGACWEASVGPDVEIKYFSLDGMNCELTSPVTTQAGALHTITITANSKGTKTIDLSNGDYIINDDGTYYFSGTAGHAIRVTGGNDNEVSSSDGAGIYVAEGSTVTITGRDRNDVLTAQGGNNGAGIGGYGRQSEGHTSCGDITISNVTVTSYGSYNDHI